MANTPSDAIHGRYLYSISEHPVLEGQEIDERAAAMVGAAVGAAVVFGAEVVVGTGASVGFSVFAGSGSDDGTGDIWPAGLPGVVWWLKMNPSK